MLKLLLARPRAAGHRILCLGAHSDDLEIGCGGTILRLLDDHKNVSLQWVVFSANHTRAKEARRSAEMFLDKAKNREIVTKSFRDGFLPYKGGEVKEFFEGLKQFAPDLIFTHYRHDLHQDHRLICELTWNTFRDHTILEYEVPKYDGDMGAPNFFVELDEDTCSKKAEYLLTNFKSQRDKHWFSAETFRSLLRLRGLECRSATGYAEAFYARKIVLDRR
ncbi:MAG TPA: PIG-L deacetylase family protein [Terriglobales bacterium]|nr:PIG-L deacetylase family protein [Terriglobales bacterium]